jgi:hypothetical protein
LFTTLFLAGVFLVSLPARAQSIKVTSAVPDTAEQGMVDLVVTIGGENFGKGSKVAFFVTGTTNPGGIVVKGVKFKDSKTLDATIDVAPDAQTDLKFDIQVMSNGRTGKGTELFSVRVKQTGVDTTPPGTVTDLHTLDVGFNTAVFSWTAPADDGYNSTSGPAARYELYVRKGFSDVTPSCGPYNETVPLQLLPPYPDPCQVAQAAYGAPGQPGGTDTAIMRFLEPNTQYWAIVRNVDDAPQPNWSDIDYSRQLSFATGPFPETPWSASIVDFCRPSESCWGHAARDNPRFDFDAAGNPVVFFTKDGVGELASWTGSGWQPESLPQSVTIDLSNWVYDFAFDRVSGQATIASAVPGNRTALKFYRRTGATSDPWPAEIVATGDVRSAILRFNPTTLTPTIAYTAAKGSSSRVLRLAERGGSSWVSKDVVSGVAWANGLAFDGNGNPAVSLVQDVNGAPALRFALRQGGSWSVETADLNPGGLYTTLHYTTVAFDPSRNDFSVAGVFRDSTLKLARVRFCDRTGAGWSCVTIEEADYFVDGVSLAFAVDGTAYLAYQIMPTLFVRVRSPGGESWTLEYADWNAGLTHPDLRLGPDGQPGVAYRGYHDPSGVLQASYPMCFARRSPPSP